MAPHSSKGLWTRLKSANKDKVWTIVRNRIQVYSIMSWLKSAKKTSCGLQYVRPLRAAQSWRVLQNTQPSGGLKSAQNESKNE